MLSTSKVAMKFRKFGLDCLTQHLTLVCLAMFAGAASGEVIDKISTPSQLWTNGLQWGFALAIIAFLVAPRRLPVLLLFALAAWFALPPVIELEFVPEAVQHYGPNYPLYANIAAWLLPLGAVLGAALKVYLRRSRHREA